MIMRKSKICKGCFDYFIPDGERINYCSTKCLKEVEWEWQEARLLDTGATDKQLEKHRRRHPKYRRRRTLMGNDAIDMQSYMTAMSELRAERMKASCSDNVNIDDLIKRDRGICYLCGGKVSKRRKGGIGQAWRADKEYPTIDHVVPLSRDGSNTWDNVKLAHWGCNERKGGSLLKAGAV